MQRLNINLIGHFPDNGYILAIIDTFTCWAKLYHIPDATALSDTQCLLKLLGRFVAPAHIRFVNGPNFTAEVFRDLLGTVGVQQCRTTPYSSEESSHVERTNCH